MRIDCQHFKKDDGTECFIIVELYCSSYGTAYLWDLVDVMYRPKRKKNYISLVYPLRNDPQYRKLDEVKKHEYVENMILSFTSREAAIAAFKYAYEYIKPKYLKDMENADGNV